MDQLVFVKYQKLHQGRKLSKLILTNINQVNQHKLVLTNTLYSLNILVNIGKKKFFQSWKYMILTDINQYL